METNAPCKLDGRWLSRCLLCLNTLLIVLIALPASAHIGSPPLSFQQKVQALQSIQQFILPGTDKTGELAADQKRGVLSPLRFAVEHNVNITPATHGTWEQLANGRLWRLRVKSAGASDLNLGFTRLRLPEGATLHVISESETYFQGPYTARDNKPHGQLWTPVLPGDAVVIELFVPTQVKQEFQLVLGHVGAGYRDMFHRQGAPPNPAPEAACEIDVVCPIAAGWTNEIRSVAVYTINGAWACSGTLIADVAGDFRNYFLTANHCGVSAENAPTMVVYWNYQSTNCGTHGPGSLAQNQSGASFRAAKSDVDFTLVELDDMPEAEFAVYYSGWDRSGNPPAGAVGIHQPESDVKAISISSNALTTVDSCINTGGINTHWQVIWSAGLTEPGSSGSGIWDPATHKLVGTLSGGGDSCLNSTNIDCYGKFSVSWNSGSSSNNCLSYWLDPQNTGVTSVTGVDPMLTTVIMAASATVVSESCSPTNGAINPGETVSIAFTLHNFGGVAATNLVATLLSTGGVINPGAAQNYGFVASGSSTSETFTFTASGYCGGTINPTFQLQDGARNLGTVTYKLTLGAPVPLTIFSQDFDEVTAPTIPVGWTSSVTAGGIVWKTSTAQASTPPNSIFAADAPSVTDNSLISPSIFINSSNAQLAFQQNYNVENGYDGGVLEIAFNGGAFADWLSVGGTFITNGYNQTINSYYGNPLAGRLAWSGNSGGFVTTTADFPVIAAGQHVQLRWRFGSDSSYGIVGWYIDSVSISEPGYNCCGTLTPPLIYNVGTVTSGNLAFSYNAMLGQSYVLETAASLDSTNWTPLQTIVGNNSRQTFTNSTTGEAMGYFRLRTMK